jgi:hypothetical protein
VSVLQGNLDFFHRVIDLSPVLAYVDVDGGPGRDSPDAEISLERDTDYFVFGGDAVYVKDLSTFFLFWLLDVSSLPSLVLIAQRTPSYCAVPLVTKKTKQ